MRTIAEPGPVGAAGAGNSATPPGPVTPRSTRQTWLVWVVWLAFAWLVPVLAQALGAAWLLPPLVLVLRSCIPLSSGWREAASMSVTKRSPTTSSRATPVSAQ